jgi:hypothetical protein
VRAGCSFVLGNWNSDEAKREAIDASGWMHSCDLATMSQASSAPADTKAA